ncbi:MAG: arsenate reductase ArsC [Firmicutes bacterium]|nr:arsenate reductase ArsC [Bacillota bacterium]
MAEGWARVLGAGKIVAHSAGIEAHGLNPRAVRVMQEAGIDISHQASQVIDPGLLNQADYVITLCGDADERCPVTPPHVTRLHWGFEDPARATGSEEEILQVFRTVRDGIKMAIQAFLQELEDKPASR